MSTIEATIQSANPGERIELFRLDASSAGGGVLFFCQGTYGAATVKFGGQSYTPVDIDFIDFEISANGALPTPKLRLSNANGVFQALINTYGDLVGCVVQRVRTFRRYLDGEPEADPTAYFGPDTFRVERRTGENKELIEWELSAAIDQESKMLPGRTIIRDTCLWRYRRWTGTGFDYSKAQCPYTGSAYFDANDNPTTAAGDRPSRTLKCCRTRFGAGNVLPFGGFPGAGRVRY